MAKGQISIDLLITLIVAIMIIGAFTIILTGFQNEQENFYLRNQLRTQSEQTAAFITSTRALSDTTFTTKLNISQVVYKNNKLTPLVRVDQNKIVFRVDYDGGFVQEESYFSRDPTYTISNTGQTLVITNE